MCRNIYLLFFVKKILFILKMIIILKQGNKKNYMRS